MQLTLPVSLFPALQGKGLRAAGRSSPEPDVWSDGAGAAPEETLNPGRIIHIKFIAHSKPAMARTPWAPAHFEFEMAKL